MNAKISIIMGIYNCASTLGESIDSLLNQTYSDWNLIMCDDGSTDDTYNVAEQYRKLYPDKIILIKNNENKGLNCTLNHCLEYAKGEYIARMDGDDISLPRRFEKEVNFLDEHPEYAIVSTPMIHFDEHGEFRRGTGGKEPVLSSLAKETPFCHATCMVRREAYTSVNGYSESPQRLRVEDWDLWIKMYKKGYRGYVLEEPLYMMRDALDAYSRRKFKFRVNEARVSYMAVKSLNLSYRYYIYILRPILVGMLPVAVYKILHRNKK